MNLKQNIKDICFEKGITLVELEKKAGLPRKYIHRWDKVIPSAEKIKRVADALEVSTDQILK